MATTTCPRAWLLRQVRDDQTLGERYALLVTEGATAALPFDAWPGATQELTVEEAWIVAAGLGISSGAFVDALDRARLAFRDASWRMAAG
jgi:hypothetical protein